MYHFRFDFNDLLTGVCSHLHYIEDFNKILFTTNSNLRWDSNFIEDCFITNYLFKAWSLNNNQQIITDMLVTGENEADKVYVSGIKPITVLRTFKRTL